MTQQQIRNHVRAAIYIRTAANNAEAAAEQRKECMQYIERKGYKFAGEFADIGASGLKDTRSALDAVTIDAHIGEIDRIVIFSMARLSRSAAKATAFCADLEESCGVIVESVEGGDLQCHR